MCFTPVLSTQHSANEWRGERGRGRYATNEAAAAVVCSRAVHHRGRVMYNNFTWPNSNQPFPQIRATEADPGAKI